MQSNIRIMVVDDNQLFCNQISHELNIIPNYEVVKTVTDPRRAITEIQELKPDVLLLDVVMPSIDGEELLERIKERITYHLGVIMISSANNDQIISRCMNLGANHFMLKPLDFILLAKKINQVVAFEKAKTKSEHQEITEIATKPAQKESENIMTVITTYLLKLGFTPKLKGFHFVREGIYYILCSDNELYTVTKIIYPHIAKIYDTEPERVERALRSAIAKAFQNPECVNIYKSEIDAMFQTDKGKSCPSNREFLFASAEYIKNGKINAII